MATWDIDAIEERTQSLADRIIHMFSYFESPRDKDDTIKIHLWSDDEDFTANAIFYCDNGNVEILAGSMLSPRADDGSDVYQYLFDDIIEQVAVNKTDTGFVFNEDFLVWSEKPSVTMLSTTAGLLLNRKVNGKDYWLDESGQAIRTNALFVDSKFGTKQK